MSVATSQKITNTEIAALFKSAVVDQILNGVYHSGNIPKCGQYQCVPTSMMDHISNVTQLPTMSSTGTVINATTLISSLVSLTRDLTRVGTFYFAVWNKVSDSTTKTITKTNSATGSVLYSKTYIVSSFGTPSNTNNTTYGNTITASDLNGLFASIFTEWKNTSKKSHKWYTLTCHNSCHSNCHTNCHADCHTNCHGWQNVGCYTNSNCYSNSTPSGQYGQPNTRIECHTNTGNSCFNDAGAGTYSETSAQTDLSRN